MVLEAGSGGCSEVDADIESLGLHDLLEYFDAVVGEFHHFGALGGGHAVQAVHVPVGRDHEVPAGVGIAVHDHRAGGAPEEQAGGPVVRALEHFAQETSPILGTQNVFDAPGRPDLVHTGYPWWSLTCLFIWGSLNALPSLSR